MLSHLQDGNLREVFLLKVSVCDELQFGLDKTEQRLQTTNDLAVGKKKFWWTWALESTPFH